MARTVYLEDHRPVNGRTLKYATIAKRRREMSIEAAIEVVKDADWFVYLTVEEVTMYLDGSVDGDTSNSWTNGDFVIYNANFG
jgi:hypothetical protein